MTDKAKSEPIPKIRAGTLELAIWKNDGEECRSFAKASWTSWSAQPSVVQ